MPHVREVAFSLIQRMCLAAAGWLLLECICVGEVGVDPRMLPSRHGERAAFFLEGQRVAIHDVEEWRNGWRIVDLDGRLVAAGGAGEGIVLPRGLECGWYEIRDALDPPTEPRGRSFTVLQPRHPAVPAVPGLGFNWFGGTVAELEGLIELGRLAGACESRDGVYPWNWRDAALVSRRGMLGAAGLALTLTTHRTRAEVGARGFGEELPWDLREAYDFLRDVAATVGPGVTCLEPWNEPDLPRFGGHIGSEVASYQKAGYLAIRAGNPSVKVGMAPLSDAHPAHLAALEENAVWPYFDSFNIHLYNRQSAAGDVFQRLRFVAQGKPIRVTECNELLDLKGLEPGSEPSSQALRAQGATLTKALVRYYGEGAASVDLYCLRDHVEYDWQFGLLRADFTPRPAYAAGQTAGRFLAGGRFLGRLPGSFRGVTGFVFEAVPDGRRRDVLIAWADHDPATLNLGVVPDTVHTWYGRALECSGRRYHLTADPVYVELPRDAARGLGLIGSPAKTRPRSFSGGGGACPVVLQGWMPRQRRDAARSAYWLSPGVKEAIGLRAYNFSGHAVKGSLRLDTPVGWKAETEGSIRLGPGEDADLALEVEMPLNAPTDGCFPVSLSGDFGRDGKATMTLRVVTQQNGQNQ